MVCIGWCHCGCTLQAPVRMLTASEETLVRSNMQWVLGPRRRNRSPPETRFWQTLPGNQCRLRCRSEIQAYRTDIFEAFIAACCNIVSRVRARKRSMPTLITLRGTRALCTSTFNTMCVIRLQNTCHRWLADVCCGLPWLTASWNLYRPDVLLEALTKRCHANVASQRQPQGLR